jgi:hypothetical protein
LQKDQERGLLLARVEGSIVTLSWAQPLFHCCVLTTAGRVKFLLGVESVAGVILGVFLLTIILVLMVEFHFPQCWADSLLLLRALLLCAAWSEGMK